MSLLAYGQGLLAGDVEDGLGVTIPWGATHPLFAWNDADTLSDTSGSGDEEIGADLFFNAVAAEAPKECAEDGRSYARSVSKDLHWDSPPPSPAAVCVHLPHSVMQIVVTALKVDIVVVGALQRSSQCVFERLLHVPLDLEVPDFLEISANSFLRCCSTGSLTVVTDDVDVPVHLEVALGCRPQALIVSQFDLDGYQGLVYGMWRDAAVIPPTAEAIFRDAVVTLPSLLSNRINAKKYENLGRRFDAILRMMPQSVVFVDDETMEVVVNPAAAELLGLESHGEVEPPKVAQAMKRIAENSGMRTDPLRIMDAIAGKDDVHIKEEWALTNPRRVLKVGSYSVSSHAAHGRLWFFEDVTVERDAQEAILAANKAKSQFLAMMSHELRTPMTGVLGMLDLLSLTELTSQQREHVKMMQDSADGLMQVLNNILDYCKMEAGRLSLEEIDFSVAEVMEQVVTLHKEKQLDDRVQLRLVGPATCKKHFVRGDPVRLRQIMMNLVNNAMRFTVHGCVTVSWKFLELSSASISVPSKVQVLPAKNGTAGRRAFRRSASMHRSGSATNLHRSGSATNLHRSGSATNLQEQGTGAADKKQLWLEVKVVDTGVGMSTEQLQGLFDGSHARSLKRDLSGAGLGLEICDGLLNLMGGAIRVESEQNCGTTVTFLLPLRPGEELEELTPSADTAAPKPSVKPPTPVPSTNDSNTGSGLAIRVLVAEDNRVNQMLIKKLFRHYGYDVELVGNGKLAVEAVQKNTYDLVLMDLQMPVLDGLSATKAIRAMQPPKCLVPIYALSADALTPESGPMEETGLTGYLSKPIVWDKMSAVLEKVLAQKRDAT